MSLKNVSKGAFHGVKGPGQIAQNRMEGLLSFFKVQGLYSNLQHLLQNSQTTVPPLGRIPYHLPSPYHFLCIALDGTTCQDYWQYALHSQGSFYYSDSRLYMVLIIISLDSIFYFSPTQLCPVHLPFNDVDCCFSFLPEGLNCTYCVLSKITAFFSIQLSPIQTVLCPFSLKHRFDSGYPLLLDLALYFGVIYKSHCVLFLTLHINYHNHF